MIVVDTNVIGYLYLSSERSGQAERVLLREAEWAAPILWRSELRGDGRDALVKTPGPISHAN